MSFYNSKIFVLVLFLTICFIVFQCSPARCDSAPPYDEWRRIDALFPWFYPSRIPTHDTSFVIQPIYPDYDTYSSASYQNPYFTQFFGISRIAAIDDMIGFFPSLGHTLLSPFSPILGRSRENDISDRAFTSTLTYDNLQFAQFPPLTYQSLDLHPAWGVNLGHMYGYNDSLMERFLNSHADTLAPTGIPNFLSIFDINQYIGVSQIDDL